MPGHLRFSMPDSLPGVTLFRAENFQQHFIRHSHEHYALGVVTNGVLGFNYRGEYHLAGAGEINLVVPGEVHTGHPALGNQWSYRMFYIQPDLMRNVAQQLAPLNRSFPFFRAGVLKDKPLASTIVALHKEIDERRIFPLEAQSRLLALLTTWIRLYSEDKPLTKRTLQHSVGVARVREFLDDCWHLKPTLSALADLAELTPHQLLRAFVREYGLPPHAYLIQRQLREAKDRLNRGSSIADVAGDCGFADQSHLNRHFKRTWGITPGQYRKFRSRDLQNAPLKSYLLHV